ncbi:ABC transporter substrate-binding protein [Amycolatopsis balhimycina DSM 5908]|uniref:ABC transporter substrate-binding protein n=1 Tax=Amycolatopsis balhimycina DSM 5908 TaxID=1081091 RepID=A0A428WSN1_AMYBA|nr:ABC transporter substrate-binding protein [Amycolatopsis balhimycina]RSM46075.1 ABC transporter substrate-binding protein [Amycolatopsis balhimycina DSM 5908]
MPHRASPRRLAALALVVAALLSACSQPSRSAAAGDVEKPSIRVAIFPAVDLATLWLAQEGGYFKAEGLDVQTDVGASGQETLTRMTNGQDDLALSTYTLFFLAKSSGTADVKLVSDATSASPRSNEIVTVPNSPVKTVNDLGGKRIAISSKNAASDVLTRSVMRDHGVATDKVQWVPMPLPEMGAALAQGRVDAAYQPEPFLTQAAKTAGAYPVVDAASGSTQAFPLTGYGATAKWAQEHPKTVRAFQRAMLNATRAAVDRARIEPLVVRNARVDQDIAGLMVMPAFGSTLDARRIQRVPDLLQQLDVVQTKIDASSMIAPQAGTG